VVTFFVFIFILIDTIFVAFFIIVSIFFTIVVGLKSSFLFIVRFCTKPSFSLAHLTKLFVAWLLVILENLVLLILLMLVLDFLNYSLSFLFPLTIFKIVGIQLILQVVDVCVLFHID
jgi:hypothetical protein